MRDIGDGMQPIVEGLVNSSGVLDMASGGLDIAADIQTGNVNVNTLTGAAQNFAGVALGKLKAANNIVKAASDLPILKQGTKAWNDAVKQLSGVGKGKVNFRTETATDAKALLRESRGNMNRRKQYTNDKNKNYEVHNDQNKRELGAGNDLQHLKWKDKKAGGHIYYDNAN